MILLIIDVPTPQRTPTLDVLAQQVSLVAVYLEKQTDDRGWGEVTVRHPQLVLRGLGTWWSLVRLLLSPSLDVVCLFGYRGSARACAAMVARVRRLPLVLRGDSSALDEEQRTATRTAVKRAYLRFLMGQGAEVWSIGSQNDRYWRLLGFNRRHRIPYTVPVPPGSQEDATALRHEVGARLDTYVFSFVGRLIEPKGLREALSAFARVHAAEQDSLLLVAGLGPLETELTPVPAGVVYLGAVPYRRLGAVFGATDCTIVPSREEPWGLVVNEALLCGSPVIASDRVAAADDLVEPDSGARFPARDVAALTEAMLDQLRRGRRRVQYAEGDTAQLMAVRLAELAGRRRGRR